MPFLLVYALLGFFPFPRVCTYGYVYNICKAELRHINIFVAYILKYCAAPGSDTVMIASNFC